MPFSRPCRGNRKIWQLFIRQFLTFLQEICGYLIAELTVLSFAPGPYQLEFAQPRKRRNAPGAFPLHRAWSWRGFGAIILIFNKTLVFKRFIRSIRCVSQSPCFAKDQYCTASSMAPCAMACEHTGSQATKRFLIVLLKNSIKRFFRATPHNTSAASSGKFVLWFRHFFLRYTKYICEKAPSSERKFSRNLLLPHYAVSP